MKSAVKDNRENKTKIIIREDLPQKFETWSVDKQYEFIKTLIKYTCEDHDNFLEYFTNDRDAKKAYKPLLNQLTCGDRNVYNRPEFKKIDNGLEMKYADEKSVNLYRGFNSKILWVDSNDSTALNQVIRNIDKIKQCELFENVHKIQCTRPSEYIDGFNFTSYTTKNNEVIYEKDLRKWD